MNKDAFLCIVRWPDGREGLLFPRPGNVAIADTLKQGQADFNKAVADLKEIIQIAGKPADAKVGISLIRFEVKEVMQHHSE